MKTIDEKLLLLYKYLEEHDFLREEVAEYIEITPRQLSRLINQWQDEGIIEYIGGIGRGNYSTIIFNVDIEQQVIMDIISNLNDYSIEEITHILSLPLNESSKRLIEGLFNNAIHAENTQMSPLKEQKGTVTMDYIYRLPENLNPLQQTDIALDTLLYNTMDRLYTISNDMTFTSKLVQYEVVDENSITLYLYQDITFSNGKNLLAVDVVNCLETLINHEWHKENLDYIYKIELVDLFALKIYFDADLDKLKFDLSSTFSSIYIQEFDAFIGTNTYYIASIKDSYIQLTARQTSHHALPEINDVFLMKSYASYESFIKDKHCEEVDKYAKMTKFVMMNPCFTQLDLQERRVLLHYIKKYYYQDYEDLTLEQYSITKKSIVMGIPDLTRHKVIPLYQYLKAVGFNIASVELPFDYFIGQNNKEIQCDFVILGHTYREETYFYKLMNYTHMRQWFDCLPEMRMLKKEYLVKPLNKWKKLEQGYSDFLTNNAYFMITKQKRRKFIVLKGQKNVKFNNDGIIIFGDILVR
ncbi:periplasmic substrate-binding domain-containing protein [Macrococcoides bohemicum]|uniref:SgrR family transcriptional regulator n=1 Tax=Macrococcoides bohemicum TaxID=1903056 RepID=UPI00193F450C|nr:SgrR family transcriptional regulator [Macrococcus bohemicus]QRN50747.1 hypothetical protein HT586_11280 [Macrococcus bohemicus]